MKILLFILTVLISSSAYAECGAMPSDPAGCSNPVCACVKVGGPYSSQLDCRWMWFGNCW